MSFRQYKTVTFEEAKAIQAKRPLKAQAIDNALKAELVSPTVWARNPARFDTLGIDYPRTDKKIALLAQGPSRFKDILWSRTDMLNLLYEQSHRTTLVLKYLNERAMTINELALKTGLSPNIIETELGYLKRQHLVDKDEL